MNNIFLESERLFLRKITMDDIDHILLLDTDPDVLRFIGPPKTKEKSIERIQGTLDQYNDGSGCGRWIGIEKSTGNVIGWYVLTPLNDTELIEVGYRLKTEYWGKGYATEMTKIIIDYGFNTLHLDKIVGVTHPDNENSQHVLKKCGLKHIGIRFYYEQDVQFFELLKKRL